MDSCLVARVMIRRGNHTARTNVPGSRQLSTWAGTLASAVMNSSVVVGVVELTGFPSAYITAFAIGALIRTATLPLSLYSDRALARHASAAPALKQAYFQYAEVALHPRALREEIDLAHQKLLARRKTILHRFDTTELSGTIPATLASIVTCVGLVAASSTIAAISPIPTTVWWDPSLGLSAIAFAFTTRCAVSRRLGFSDRTDSKLNAATKYGKVLVPLATLGAYSATGAAALLGIPVHPCITVAFPLQLGAASVNFVRPLWDAAGIGKRWLRWPAEYPSSHGTYGEHAYSIRAHHERLEEVFQANEAAKHRDNYYSAKHSLESECDVRIQKMPIAQKFFRDTRYDRPPQEAASPYKTEAL